MIGLYLFISLITSGLDEEKATGFQDHVFLERHLAGWCPRVGPIRHFMELVTSALSKNPHMTAARKKEVGTTNYIYIDRFFKF